MKKMKFFALGLALLSMVGFTSCLNSNDTGSRSMYAYLEVNNYLGVVTYTDVSGVQIIPSTTPTTTPTSKLIYAYMEYDQSSVSTNMTSLKVNNFNYANLTEATAGEQPSLSGVTCLLGSSPAVYGKNKYLIFPITFNMKASSETDQATELNSHKFYAYANPETDLQGDVLTIHLRQTIDGLDSSLDGKSIGQVYTNSKTLIMYFSLTQFAQMSNSNGTAPTKIRLAYQQSSSAEAIAPDATDQKESYSSEVSLATSN